MGDALPHIMNDQAGNNPQVAGVPVSDCCVTLHGEKSWYRCAGVGRHLSDVYQVSKGSGQQHSLFFGKGWITLCSWSKDDSKVLQALVDT